LLGSFSSHARPSFSLALLHDERSGNHADTKHHQKSLSQFINLTGSSIFS
jgi:hypothetical protein